MLLALALPFWVNAAEEEKEPEFSEAETLLFLTDHLENISAPGELRYEFVHRGSLEENFTDRVILRIDKVLEDGFKSAEIDFLEGDRHQYVPPNAHTNLNGVILVFLQGDTYEMARLTPGSSRYFHRRMKYGFAYEAEVEPVTFTFDGREVTGRKVTMKPFINDPHRPEFEEYAHKVYTFILSKEVPGMLYQIHTIIPDMSKEEEGKAFEEPLIEERLTLVKAELGEPGKVAQMKP
ncbi:MAG: hypothetical protein D6786_04515 [Gammaproteobacteria bacterium]|nr:MAG: hypothetical protein D6786_04515 [Gammaproteobacteria bacterium]